MQSRKSKASATPRPTAVSDTAKEKTPLPHVTSGRIAEHPELKRLPSAQVVQGHTTLAICITNCTRNASAQRRTNDLDDLGIYARQRGATFIYRPHCRKSIHTWCRRLVTDMCLPALPVVNLPHAHHNMRWSVPTGAWTVSERIVGQDDASRLNMPVTVPNRSALKTIASSSRPIYPSAPRLIDSAEHIIQFSPGQVLTPPQHHLNPTDAIKAYR